MVFYNTEQHDFVRKSSAGLFGRWSTRMLETSINEIQSKQAILEMDFDRTHLNG